MIESRWKAGGLILAVATVIALAAATAQVRPAASPSKSSFDPALALVALRLAPPDPIRFPPEAGLDAARAELAAGLALSENLARGRAAGVMLTPPAAGPILEGFGNRQPGGLRAQGLTFKAPSGAEIRSPSGGDVLYAGPLEGWGEAIIVQATPRAQVVLAGDFSSRVREGEALREGQALGRAADRGAEVNLYLELRDLGRPIDPEPWLRPEKAASQGSGFSGETG
ncbi:MAG: peptidoglycan DD-metalloendopeptidase family protein [Phenylobacterium sp.]|uniref:murein hydrolase activator EnvC family protein n=1 Tax=Phenylobacterium sp. TaxID=1871053 RepID=UPI0025FB46F9|nr:peptidoglycan DD-metalloendopeptidase family protein [Phenylobacterium sp.]MCA3715597.1 peptidoglycan DD-metalloendopeptidase family protein [Phenylobacterium sp.]MCA3726782.1 peptidoglycan DD-metalloendopeptidase family protein [Phenylobacterium sp.]MCA3731460.1 peptidoglycan DD-metalloendopeptidase family protein [Phenylobacterium sp.]MCA3734687.1 peptidoglycan DD-metalloendopeptidase family protein [Phenylobacterium sp.]MCA3757554.1 peptidoglycan DD-metalloendopeptidase family protein [P